MRTAAMRLATATASRYVYLHRNLLQQRLQWPPSPSCRHFASATSPPVARPRPRPQATGQAPPKSTSSQPDSSEQARESAVPGLRRNIVERWVKATGLRSGLTAFIFILPIAGFIFYHFPISVIPVTGASMAPTINPGCTSDNSVYTRAWIVVQKWDPKGFEKMAARAQFKNQKIGSKYERGDMVVYYTPHNPELWAVKRVVGVAGDRVTPIDGGEPVIVPFNHLWVEGDAGDKSKSMDSNYFGPISARMVKGKVLAVLPEWNPATWREARSLSTKWPAREQNRIEEEAVEEATANPSHVERYASFEGAMGQIYLKTLRVQSEDLKLRFTSSEAFRKQAREQWILSRVAARGHPDPETKHNAKAIAKAYEDIFTLEGLRDADPDRKKQRRYRGQATNKWSEADGPDEIEAEIIATFGEADQDGDE